MSIFIFTVPLLWMFLFVHDDDYGSSGEVLGLATYSNSESTVSSYASIFEILGFKQNETIRKRTYH
jgi:hypothetical protein